MAEYIDKQIIKSDPIEFMEDVESVTFFPQTKRVEVKTFKTFMSKAGNSVKQEAGVIEKFNFDVEGLIEKVRDAVIEHRKGKK